MGISVEETWFGLARAISSADGVFSKEEFIAASKAGERLLNIPRGHGQSPWANTTENHMEIVESFKSLCAEDHESCISILTGLVHIAQADGEASAPEAELMWRLFQMAEVTEEQVIKICGRARELFGKEG
jgi:uncharacterized tellurite resistance protein B-like protein